MYGILGNSPKVGDFLSYIEYLRIHTARIIFQPSIMRGELLNFKGCISWGPQPLQGSSHHQDVTFLGWGIPNLIFTCNC